MELDGIALETKSLAEQVYRYLSNRIIEGKINCGDVLNIKHIAGSLSVSPMPVRDAIKRLEIDGIVTIRPRSTCLIRVPTRKSILDALDMREVLEIECVRRVVDGSGNIPLERMKRIAERMRTIVEDPSGVKDVNSYIADDFEFHAELCRTADNAFIDKMHREISFHLNMNCICDTAVSPDIEGTYRDHLELLEALSVRSSVALTIIKRHLRRSRQNVLQGRLFSEPEIPVGP